MELRYNAIVLKKKEVGETDRLYTFYTAEQGKIQLVGKGVRKPGAKLAGQLETLTRVFVIAVKSRGIGKIAGAVAENFFVSLRLDVDALRIVLDTLSTFERLVEWDEPDQKLYQLLCEYLELAERFSTERKQEKIMLLSVGFLFQLFAHLGYRIETGVCAVSGERLRSGEQHFFSPSQGGMLSGEHHRDTHSFPVTENAIKLLRLFLSNRLETLDRIRVHEREVRELRQMALYFFRWISR